VLEHIEHGLEYGGTALTIFEHFLKHGSEGQIFTGAAGSGAHYLAILISSWKFGKDPSLSTGYDLASAGVDKFLLERGPPGWVAYGAKGWVTLWAKLYTDDRLETVLHEETLRIEAKAEAKRVAREAAREAEQRRDRWSETVSPQLDYFGAKCIAIYECEDPFTQVIYGQG
jgi:hypothetical protein